MRRLALTILLLALSARTADAMLLSCFPQKTDGPVKIDLYVDGFAPGAYPPTTIEAVRVLMRFGADVYEIEPEHLKEATLRDGILRIRLEQPLSAGVSVEVRFEGKLAAKKGEEFTLQVFIRNERRSAEGAARCMID
jgi:hypothetical protein